MGNKIIFTQCKELSEVHAPCVLATVVEASGSTPQVPGSSAIIGRSGLLAGTVGGGPAEYKVVCKAMAAVDSGISEIMTFELDGNLPEGSDSICGGHMTVLLDASPEKHAASFENLANAIQSHTPGILITKVEEKGDNVLQINRIWFDETHSEEIPDDLFSHIGPSLSEMLASPSAIPFRKITLSGSVEEKVSFVCLETILPLPSLIIAGAGHVGKAVARIGKFLGFEVTVWDDRSELANAINIPEAGHHLSCNLDDLDAQLVINQHTYLVIVTRGHKYDALVLRKWIHTHPAYLGMMGSRTKIEQMRQQFLEKGWATKEEWERVHTPIGLKIGAKTVEEIAISISAELIYIKNKPS
jgi:xanthine dehydrogenase accessory factor